MIKTFSHTKIIRGGKTIIEAHPLPVFYEVDGVKKPTDAILAKEEYLRQKEAESQTDSKPIDAKDAEEIEILNEIQKGYQRHLEAKITIDAEIDVSVRGRNDAIKQAEKAAGIKYPLHFAWLDGAESDTGVIEFPKNNYSKVYAIKGTYEQPEIIFLKEAKPGMRVPPGPYYTINDGKTQVYMDGFSGAGTAQDPYQVATYADLCKVGTGTDGWDLDAYYIQTADIQCPTSPKDNFVPIGTSANRFTGQYDGGNKTITGLYINRSNADYIGLFGYVDGAFVKNVHLIDVDISGKLYVGALVGYKESTGHIDNCHSSGAVKSNAVETSVRVGGLIGRASFASGEAGVTNCHSDATVIAQGGNVGGFVGYASTGAAAGQTFIQRCYATGNVTGGNTNVGGFAGTIYKNTVLNCYATGNIVGVDNVGGFVGHLNYYAGSRYCYSTGSVGGTGSYVYGFVGRLATSSGYGPVTCRFDMETSGHESGGHTSALARTTAEMKTLATFSAWGIAAINNFDPEAPTVWYIDEGNDYPRLGWQYEVPAPDPPSVTTGSASSVTADSATLNGTLTDLGDDDEATTHFEYGKTTSYGTVVNAGTKTATGAFSAGISGLQPDTAYHFRAYAINANGRTNGDDAIFTTEAAAEPVYIEARSATATRAAASVGTAVSLSARATTGTRADAALDTSVSIAAKSSTGTRAAAAIRTPVQIAARSATATSADIEIYTITSIKIRAPTETRSDATLQTGISIESQSSTETRADAALKATTNLTGRSVTDTRADAELRTGIAVSARSATNTRADAELHPVDIGRIVARSATETRADAQLETGIAIAGKSTTETRAGATLDTSIGLSGRSATGTRADVALSTGIAIAARSATETRADITFAGDGTHVSAKSITDTRAAATLNTGITLAGDSRTETRAEAAVSTAAKISSRSATGTRADAALVTGITLAAGSRTGTRARAEADTTVGIAARSATGTRAAVKVVATDSTHISARSTTATRAEAALKVPVSITARSATETRAAAIIIVGLPIIRRTPLEAEIVLNTPLEAEIKINTPLEWAVEKVKENQNFRVPAGDYHIVGFTATIPSSMTLQGCTIKWVLAKRGSVLLRKETGSGIIIKSDNSFEVELVTGDTKGLSGIYDHEATVFDPLNRQFTSVQGQAHIIAKKDPGD